MNTYSVTYQVYNDTKTILIAAKTVLSAYNAARVWIRKKDYTQREVISVQKVAEIHAMGKD